ncbi:MAG: response regulator [Chloroflexi bacterium]|nr:response regulator [Chloroflexota bacterium]
MKLETHRRKLVLIVEDEPDNQEIMRAVVEDLLGYEVLLVADGVSAVEAAVTKQPDLILMDLMIPVLDGLEATSKLKSDKTTSHIPVVAITALGRASDRQHSFESGAEAYVSKPFDLDQLVSLVKEHVDSAPAAHIAEVGGPQIGAEY